jgi:hypothetical protein
VLAFVLVATLENARRFVKFTREDQEIKRATSHATGGIWAYKYEPLASYCCRLASPWAVLVYSCRLASPRSLRLCCCRLANTRAVVVRGDRHLPHVRPQSQVEVSKPSTPSADREVTAATPRARSREHQGRTKMAGPGGQDQEVKRTTTRHKGTIANPRSRGRGHDAKTTTERLKPRV